MQNTVHTIAERAEEAFNQRIGSLARKRKPDISDLDLLEIVERLMASPIGQQWLAVKRELIEGGIE